MNERGFGRLPKSRPKVNYYSQYWKEDLNEYLDRLDTERGVMLHH